MTSLAASLPSRGSNNWRSDHIGVCKFPLANLQVSHPDLIALHPGLIRLILVGDEELRFIEEMRVRHVAIRDAAIQPLPTPHAVSMGF